MLFFFTFCYRFPFNTQTNIGYFFEIILSISCGAVYVLANGLILTLFISMCWNHLAFHRMFRHFIKKIENNDNGQNNAENLANLIKFHIQTKK